MTDAAVPSWEGVRERRSARLRRVDQKLVIAVLIGLVSVTGAVMTWQSSQLGENAVDRDRQAIAETVLQEQSNANVETQLRDEQQAFAQYKQQFANAALLETEADQLESAGATVDAARARDQAGEQREVANNLASLTFSTAYVVFDDRTGLPKDFLIDQRRSDLRQNDSQAAKVNPDQTVEQAVDFRRRSQRLEGWTIPLVLAVLLLTIATITKRSQWRPWLGGAAVLIFVVSASIGFLGN
jgi:protein-S-isoprenylcysteine O-methyltransferase Ste14